MFDWEESLFHGIQKAWRALRRKAEGDHPERVLLADIAAHCQLLARLIAGRPLHLLAAEHLGGRRGDVLLLPRALALTQSADTNLRFLMARTALAALAPAPADGDGSPWSARLEHLAAVAVGLRRAARELPSLARDLADLAALEFATRPAPATLSPLARDFERLRRLIHEGAGLDLALERRRFRGALPTDLPEGLWLSGDVLPPGDRGQADLIACAEPNAHQATGNEFCAPPKDHALRVALPQVDEVEPLPLHTFEKTETLDTYKGGSRNVDGDDELADHLEALDELDLRQVVRGGPETQGLYKAELNLESQVGDVHHRLPGDQGLGYPEWHYRSKTYRPDWVTVFPTPVRANRAHEATELLARHRTTVLSLANRLIAQREQHERLSRQVQGDEIDLDAAVAGRADRRAGRDPGECFYQTNRKQRRDLAITLLYDVSLSAGSWIEGRRVLDVTREAVLILGEVAERLGDQLRIQAFASNTRNHCRCFDIKDWHEPWRTCRGRILAVEPQGYTRVGPALRHAIAAFAKVPARAKILLLITDGKPIDYDAYEGRYGIEDIRMALREAGQQGIHPFAVALDPKAAPALPLMFGPNGWQLLRHIGGLAEVAVQAYARASRR